MKYLWIVLGCLAGLIVAGYLVTIFFLGSVVTAGVNRIGPRLAGTRVHLDSAHLSPFSGEGDLKGLVVGNPPGWSSADAISIGRIHLQVEPSTVLGDHVVVKELEIDSPDFLYETRLVTSNISALLKNIEGGKSNPENQAKTKTGETKRFEIDHLLIKDGKIRVAMAGGAGITVPMPTFEFHDLGKGEGGVSSAELAALLGKAVLDSVAKSAMSAVGQMGKTGTGAASDLLRSATGLFHH